MATPIETVRRFCDLMSTRDANTLVPLLDEDATYQNVGSTLIVGSKAIVENLRGQFGQFPDSYEYKTVNAAADGSVVLTERIDVIRTLDGELCGIPVMGAFVVENGKIVRWTDYWDTSLPRKAMAGEDIEGLVPPEY